jgi:hypothetical protein
MTFVYASLEDGHWLTSVHDDFDATIDCEPKDVLLDGHSQAFSTISNEHYYYSSVKGYAGFLIEDGNTNALRIFWNVPITGDPTYSVTELPGFNVATSISFEGTLYRITVYGITVKKSMQSIWSRALKFIWFGILYILSAFGLLFILACSGCVFTDPSKNQYQPITETESDDENVINATIQQTPFEQYQPEESKKQQKMRSSIE